ncbi:MAG: BatA domain-containing protein [Planctomycetota bacterium]
MTALVFLNPLLLFALPLIAVPIVIHLLNRRRFDKRPWAAMDFLLKAMKLNRRRLRMEQWLVLALRTLAVLLLVLLVARPRISGGLLGGELRHHLVCVDDSASMAHRGGADNAMDRAKEAVLRMVAGLADQPGGDLLTLVTTSHPDQPLLSAVPAGPELSRRAREALAGLQVGDIALDLGTLLPRLGDIARANRTATRTETVIVTDARRHDWTTRAGEPNGALITWLTALDAERGHLEVVDVGARDAENLAVAEVRCVERVATVGIPLAFEIEIRNTGRAESSPVELAIGVDGKNRSPQAVPAVAPGASTIVAFSETFHVGGWHTIRATLPADRYAVDDARSLAFEVRPNSRVILIDGAQGESAEEAETYYIAVALDPLGDGSSGIDVRVHADHDFATIPADELDGADMLVFANVSRFTPEAVDRAETFARSGGGVVFFLGDQVDVANYQQLLWKDGRGLMPLPIVGVSGDLDHPRSVHFVDDEASLFTQSRDELRTWFGQLVLVGRWFTAKTGPDLPADIALRIGDADGDPLLVSRSFGSGGRVHLITTTADVAWTDWPRWPPFVITLERLHATSARPQDFARSNLAPTGTFEVTVDPSKHRPDVEVRRADGSGDPITFAAPPAGSDVVAVRIPMRDLSGYGAFVVARKTHAGGEDSVLVSRNPLLEESDLEPIGIAGLTSSVPEELRDRFSAREGGEGAGSTSDQGSSLWRLLGFVMLAAMLVETVLAWRFGRR